MMLWGLTRLELACAIERRAREGLLRPAQQAEALRRAQGIADDAHEIVDLAAVLARCVAVLARHAQRSWSPTRSLLLTVVVRGRRLAGDAAREGLDVLTWPE